MLTGLKKPLVAGQSFPLTLRFEHAQPVTVDVQVRAIGREAAPAAPMGDHDHMKMQ
jgi:copper(I)-binding protein